MSMIAQQFPPISLLRQYFFYSIAILLLENEIQSRFLLQYEIYEKNLAQIKFSVDLIFKNVVFSFNFVLFAKNCSH